MTHLTEDFSQAVKLSAEVLARARTDFSGHGGKRGFGSHAGRWKQSKGRDPYQPEQMPHRAIGTAPRGVRNRSQKQSKRSLPADLITLGPGSLYTSVIPNLLVDGMPRAIAASPALKAYFVNLMSQPGETTHFRASTMWRRSCGMEVGL